MHNFSPHLSRGSSNGDGKCSWSMKNRGYRPISRFISETIQEIASYYATPTGTLCDLSNGAIFNYLEWSHKVATLFNVERHIHRKWWKAELYLNGRLRKSDMIYQMVPFATTFNDAYHISKAHHCSMFNIWYKIDNYNKILIRTYIQGVCKF